MDKKVYSMDIVRAVKDFLDSEEWRYEFDEEHGLFRTGLALKSRLKSADVALDVRRDSFIVYVIIPLRANAKEEEEIKEIALFLSYVNYGLICGNFELDPRDGEIRYKCFVDCEGVVPTREMVRNNIFIPPHTIDRYADGLLGVLFGAMSAKDAVEKCES